MLNNIIPIMPAISDWINNPLDIVNQLYDQDSASHVKKVHKYFNEKLSEKRVQEIPSLNDVAPHDLHTDKLVRFRCMVQDMYDPEFYLGQYEVKDVKSGTSRLVSGIYKDLAQCQPNEELLLESPKNVTLDRQTLYCVPIPGEAEWVKLAYRHSCLPGGSATTSYSNPRQKRSLDDDSDTSIATDSAPPDPALPAEGTAMETENGVNGEQEVGGVVEKKSKTSVEQEGANARVSHDLNFPLPGEAGPACLVKIYDNVDGYKLNEMQEFIGILSNDPALASFPTDKKEESVFGNGEAEFMEGIEEHNAHSPPPSLVPRLHVLAVRKLHHNNPLLPADVKAEDSIKVVEGILEGAKETREQLISLLSRLLLGDRLAAEFLLCHLISTVYARQDVVALGKYSLNLSNCPRNSKYTAHFAKVLQLLVSKSHLLPMSLGNMNKEMFTPRKDYKANRLRTGLLQLSDDTQLILDETAMQAGQLDAKGVKNLTALGNVVHWQKAEYDFEFHTQDFHTNLPILVLSEGKSLIQCDSLVSLSPLLPTDNLDHHFSQIEEQLTPAVLQQLRTYLGLVRHLEYSLADDVQKLIEEDFVQMRKANPKTMTIDDFHSLLILSRLLSLSHGQRSLNDETWQLAKQMETQRRNRITHTTAPSS